MDLFSPMLTSPPDASATRLPDREAGSTMPDTWGALMEAAQDGHSGAYRRLLREISPWLQRYFRRRLPHGDIDDAVQETLLAIHRRRHTFDPREPLEPWLMVIAKRKWIDQLRGMARRAAEALPDDLAVGSHEDAVTSASVLARLLEELRPAQAQAITLVKVHGYSIADASRETGLSPSAVKMNIHRGLARLSGLLEKSDMRIRQSTPALFTFTEVAEFLRAAVHSGKLSPTNTRAAARRCLAHMVRLEIGIDEMDAVTGLTTFGSQMMTGFKDAFLGLRADVPSFTSLGGTDSTEAVREHERIHRNRTANASRRATINGVF